MNTSGLRVVSVGEPSVPILIRLKDKIVLGIEQRFVLRSAALSASKNLIKPAYDNMAPVVPSQTALLTSSEVKKRYGLYGKKLKALVGDGVIVKLRRNGRVFYV